ncbi:MAG: molybdopterin-guanine dinucleotide biosynthesis protein MobB [Chitinophagaceae bacterium]|nr:MAG: molybdopterin-guanine dinucleotide biosynthesis protein MobB [Chitinophagaceae bacterium]
MYINITDSATASNKGSSSGLVHYLEKENRVDDQLKNEHWFNHTGNRIEPYEVRNAIDGNIAKLCKADAKFFLVNISPSQKELKYLKEEYGKKEMKKQLKKYAEKVMDEYAKNFKREGINSAKDLMWFGKIENYRYYGHRDKEVMNGERKRGEKKEGNQMHIQIIVSRKDATNKVKLSPMNNSRGKNEVHSKKLGQFNRAAFKQSGETIFDGLFRFDRGLKETFAHANVQKNGSTPQREQMGILELANNRHYNSERVNEMARDVADGRFPSVADMVEETGKSISGLIEALLEPVHSNEPIVNPVELAERKRQKQQVQESQGLGR